MKQSTASAIPRTTCRTGISNAVKSAGTGFGAAIHLSARQALAGVSVVAIAGTRQEKTAEIARIHGVDKACDGFAALLAEDLDAVTLALPPALAETAAALALDRGLAILAEKPLARSPEAAEALAGRAAGSTAIVDFEFAELHCFRTLHALLQRAEIGPIERVAVEWTTRSHAHRHRLWSWKTDAAGNGGVLTLLGTHVLFLLEWLFERIAVPTRAPTMRRRRNSPHWAASPRRTPLPCTAAQAPVPRLPPRSATARS